MDQDHGSSLGQRSGDSGGEEADSLALDGELETISRLLVP
jgi:hypothetical protein